MSLCIGFASLSCPLLESKCTAGRPDSEQVLRVLLVLPMADLNYFYQAVRELAFNLDGVPLSVSYCLSSALSLGAVSKDHSPLCTGSSRGRPDLSLCL